MSTNRPTSASRAKTVAAATQLPYTAIAPEKSERITLPKGATAFIFNEGFEYPDDMNKILSEHEKASYNQGAADRERELKTVTAVLPTVEQFAAKALRDLLSYSPRQRNKAICAILQGARAAAEETALNMDRAFREANERFTHSVDVRRELEEVIAGKVIFQ